MMRKQSLFLFMMVAFGFVLAPGPAKACSTGQKEAAARRAIEATESADRGLSILDKLGTDASPAPVRVQNGVAMTQDEALQLMARARSSSSTTIIPNLDSESSFWIRENGRYYQVQIEGAANGSPTFRITRVSDTPPASNDSFRNSLEAATGETISPPNVRQDSYRGLLTRAQTAEQLPAFPPENLETTSSGLGLPTDDATRGLAQGRQFYFVPPENSALTDVTLRGQTGIEDQWGNIWRRGPSRTAGEGFEWDVQLNPDAPAWMRSPPVSRDGRHINVSLTGRITH